MGSDGLSTTDTAQPVLVVVELAPLAKQKPLCPASASRPLHVVPDAQEPVVSQGLAQTRGLLPMDTQLFEEQSASALHVLPSLLPVDAPPSPPLDDPPSAEEPVAHAGGA
jgi:hypothetical protein